MIVHHAITAITPLVAIRSMRTLRLGGADYRNGGKGKEIEKPLTAADFNVTEKGSEKDATSKPHNQ